MNPPRFRPLLLAVLALCLLAGVDHLLAQRPQGPLPRVHFVATGGTISNRDGGRLSLRKSWQS